VIRKNVTMMRSTVAQIATPQDQATGSGAGAAIRQYGRSQGTTAKAARRSSGQANNQDCSPRAVKIAQPSNW